MGSGEPDVLPASVARNLPRLTCPAHRCDRYPWFSSARTLSRQSRCPVSTGCPLSFLAALGRSSSPPRPTATLVPCSPLHRRRGCRRNAVRRLLDHLQPQLTRLPPQRLDLLLLHLGLPRSDHFESQ